MNKPNRWYDSPTEDTQPNYGEEEWITGCLLWALGIAALIIGVASFLGWYVNRGY